MNLRLSRTSVKSGIVEHTKKEGLIQTNLVPRGVTKANPVPRFGCQVRFLSPDRLRRPQLTGRNASWTTKLFFRRTGITHVYCRSQTDGWRLEFDHARPVRRDCAVLMRTLALDVVFQSRVEQTNPS